MGRKPIMYIMVGLPASGKTTYVRNSLKWAVRISSDDLIAMVGEKYDVELSPVYHAMEDAGVKAAVKAGYDVVIDRTSVTRKARARWVNLAQELGIKTRAVVMMVGANECKKRNLERPGPVPEEVIDRMVSDLEFPVNKEGIDYMTWVVGN